MTRIVLVMLAFYATVKLGDEFRRLLFQTDILGAIDFKTFHRVTSQWAAGINIYATGSASLYPPATWVMLWPFMGWLAFEPARWVWAATMVIVLAWMAVLVVRESGATTGTERSFVALMFLSMNAAGVTVGNGQLALHVLPVLLAGVLWLRESRRWDHDLVAALCIIAALLKPSNTAPFLWLVVVLARRVRPVLMIVVGYLALTLVGLYFQGGDLVTIMRALFARGVLEASRGGYANLGFWLGNAGLQAWILPAALGAFLALGAWVYRYRHVDVWILLGVSALVARFWTYHRTYDDVLIIFAEVALFRIATRGDVGAGEARIAAVLLGATIVSMLFFGTWEVGPPPLDWIFAGGHTLVWLADLIYLVGLSIRDGGRKA